MFFKIWAYRGDGAVRDMSVTARVRRLTTFSAGVYRTVRTLNELLERDISDIHFFFEGHVRGFKELVYEKPLDMALLYVAICSEDRGLRSRALKRLKQEADNYNSTEMPLNTRRVLMALMKECVKAKGDTHLQHQLMDRFFLSLSGRASVVRRSLKLLGLPEVPETQLNGSTYPGWDHHVYDNLAAGRKTPSQVVLDAYLKGLSRVTIVYEDLRGQNYIEEALRAGMVLGVQVDCALEYIVQHHGRHFHQTMVFEHCRTPEDHRKLFRDARFKSLYAHISRNDLVRTELFKRTIDRFNRECLSRLGYELGMPVPKLELDDLQAYAKGRALYQVHLGRYLHSRLAQLCKAAGRALPGHMDKVYLRKQYFDPIYHTLMDGSRFVDARVCFKSMLRLRVENSAGILICPRVVLNRPLVHGLEHAIGFILDNHRYVSAVEVWNNRISDPDYQEKALLLNELRVLLNGGDVRRASQVLHASGIAVPEEQLRTASLFYQAYGPLRGRIGSNSDGHNHKVPGMGFVLKDAIRWAERLKKTNGAELVPFVLTHWHELEDSLGVVHLKNVQGTEGNVLPLGKSERAKGRFLPENRRTDRFSRFRDQLRDLNMHIKDGVLMMLGTAASYAVYCLNAAFSYDQYVHAFWFAITYGRNMVVDLVAKNGWDPKDWRLKDFDPHNAAVSMFFSFVSIPLLRIADHYFQMMVLTSSGSALDQAVDQMISYIAACHEGIATCLRTHQHKAAEAAQKFLNYMYLAAINGAYIYGHNTFRSFTKDVKRRNLLRSFIAGPIAFCLSYFFGWAGIALSTVLVGKIASELVGGYIEGSVKSRKEYRRNYRTLEELVPGTQLQGTDEGTVRRVRTALLDIMDILWDNPRSRTALRRILARAGVRDLKVFLTPYHDREQYESYITEQLPIRKAEKVLTIFKRIVFAYGPWMEDVIKDLEEKRSRAGMKWYRRAYSWLRKMK